jgi:uncharacterized protein
MFGKYQNELAINHDNLTIRVCKQSKIWLYERSLDKDHLTKKVILNNSLDLIIQPIAPILLPKPITPFLMVALNQEMIVPATTSQTVYLVMPIEIGCFLLEKNGNKEAFLLDNFQLSLSKFTLYGTPSEGKICQYCASDTHIEVPEVEYLHQAVLKVKIRNQVAKPIKLSKIIFDARKLALYQQDKVISSTISLNLEYQNARTECLDEPIYQGMSAIKNHPLPNKWLQPHSKKFVMDNGL